MEARVRKEVNLAQLTAEIRATPGMEGIAGLSAVGPLDGSGELIITVHAAEDESAVEMQRAIEDVIAAHEPLAAWGVSPDEKELLELGERPAGALTLADLERAVRLIISLSRIGGGAQ